MVLLVSVICQIVVGLSGVFSVRGSALGSEGATSSASVSKPGEGKFDYNIDHSYYGSVYGWAYPHGYGGLGDGSGGYKTGGAHYIGVLPQSVALWPSPSYGHGEHSGLYDGHSVYGSGYGLHDEHSSYGVDHGHGLSYGDSGHGLYGGHATSYSNYNQKSKDWSDWNGLNSYGYGGGYKAVSHGWH